MSSGELLLVIGPPAVGKMTLGRAICSRSDFRLFHNHHTIEPLLEIFGFGTPPFNVLKHEFNRRVIEEAAAHDLRLLFSFVWNVEAEDDTAGVRDLIAPYVDAGMPISCVELYADLPTRLERNIGEDRVDAKRSKRDLVWSDAHVRELEATYRMNTDPDRPSAADAVLARLPHLRLDNTDLTPDEAASRVLDWLTATR
jgi:hypothetical protein